MDVGMDVDELAAQSSRLASDMNALAVLAIVVSYVVLSVDVPLGLFQVLVVLTLMAVVSLPALFGLGVAVVTTATWLLVDGFASGVAPALLFVVYLLYPLADLTPYVTNTVLRAGVGLVVVAYGAMLVLGGVTVWGGFGLVLGAVLVIRSVALALDR